MKSEPEEQHVVEEEEMLDECEEEEDFVPTKAKQKRSGKHMKPLPQASYIMKLFDRSVNLAQFKETTPLYPLCRSWMKNQPRLANVKSEKTVEPVITTVEDGDVVEMPKIRIRKPRQVAMRNSKINTKDFDKRIDSEVWTKEKLLDFHRERWQDERARHIENSRIFEGKHFSANLELIESLLKESEE